MLAVLRLRPAPPPPGGAHTPAVATLGHLFKERQVELEVNLPEKVPAVQGDRDHLIQVVINLLSNAEKFCPPADGRVAVTLSADADAVTVTITDSGPGIPLADQQLIFEKFHQVRDSRTGNPIGAGLGLTICRRIVEHLGGRIWVESEPGEGATLSFSIPCTRP